MKLQFGTDGALAGGALAALGASACCVGPLVLVTLGIGGAWVSSLMALEPLRPALIALTVALFAGAGWRLYRAPPLCEPDQLCAVAAIRRRQRVVFWALAAFVAVLLAFPWYAPLFY